jgi:hypothetical protein
MPLQNFVDFMPPSVKAAWLNSVDRLKFTVFDDAATKAAARTALELDSGLAIFGIDTGAVNAAVVTLQGPVTGYVRTVGSKVNFTPVIANNGAATLNVNGTGTAPIVNQRGNALTGGELSLPLTVVWTGAAWQIIEGSIPIPFARQPAEVTPPVSYLYPLGDIRRYGAVSGQDSTIAMQTAMNVALSLKGAVYVPEGTWLCDPGLVLTFSSDRYNTGFTMIGAGPGSIIQVRGTPVGFNFIELKGLTPTAAPNDALIYISSLSIIKTGAKSGSGLVLNNVAGFILENVMIRGFDRCLYLLSALVGTSIGSHFTDGNTGVYARQNGYPGVTGVTAGSTVNLIEFDAGCRFNYNTSWGVDYDNGCGVVIDGDIEANGTLGNVNTGGVRIGPNMAPDAQVCTVKLKGWFEANLGTQIRIETQSVSFLDLDICPKQLVASDAGRAIIINGCTSAWIHDFSCGPGENFIINGSKSLLQNIVAATITDNTTAPVWINVSTSTGTFPFGKPGSYVGTATGVSGQPASPTISYIIQGDLVQLLFDGNFVSTSNATTYNITGMPVAIRPLAQRASIGVVFDNGNAIPGRFIINTDGTINVSVLAAGIYNSAGFTAAGTKGVATGSVSFKR